MPRSVELGDARFSVVDVETTGFSPWLHDRVVEVAVVRMDPAGGILDEYVTLVNPERDVGRTDIHGIRASDVRDAPRWKDVAGDVGARLQNVVLAAHNLRFDLGFITAEFTRAGVNVPTPLPGLCTLALAARFYPELGSHKLRHCCAHAGIEHDDEHSALGDAKATAHLLASLLTVAQASGVQTLERLGCRSSTLPDMWCHAAPSGRAHPRPTNLPGAERSYLARLVEKLPPTPFSDPDQAAYLDLLDRALEDRHVTASEADTLLRTASEWGLTRAAVFEAHHNYLASLVGAAVSDSVVTSEEYADLEKVCDLLGLHSSALETQLRQAHAQAGLALPRALEASIEAASRSRPERASPPSAVQQGHPDAMTVESLKGRSVCFTGTFMGRVGGEIVSREQVEQMAAEAGLVVLRSVTKKLDLLVAADVETLSSKAKRARELNITILGEADFWRAIAAPVHIAMH